ncbi:MAG: hypothetical protein B6U97_00675 [Candidatus Altiarchaeales archaeon ex4484_96]|nr:MAG: hypothetical protein B6U97_00675 [Candidatus Altiarchaeales archaeon ex4484_96]
MDGVTVLFLAGGLFFFITATIGLLRFPDLYTRLHATGKGDTLGASLILLGLGLYSGISTTTAKLLIMMIFIMLTSPVATHTISRAVYNKGVKPWVREVDG